MQVSLLHLLFNFKFFNISTTFNQPFSDPRRDKVMIIFVANRFKVVQERKKSGAQNTFKAREMNLQSSVNATNAPALKLETNVQDNTTSPNLETCLNDKASPLDTCSPVTATNPEFKKIIKTDSSHSANYKDELILLEDIEKLTGALQQHRLSKSTNNPIDILKSRASVSSKKSSLPRIPHNVTQTSGSLKRDGSSRKSSQAEMIEDKRESILDEKARKRASHQGKIYNSSNYSNYRSVPNISKIPASDNQPNADVSRVSSTSRNAIEKPTIHVYPRFEIRVSSSHNSIHNSNERKLSLSGSVDRSDSIFETNISDDGSNAKAQQIASDMFKPRVARPPTTIEENELLQIKIPHSSEPIQETNSPSPKMASSFQSTNSPQSPTAVQLGFANNQEYYEYLMLSQRHVSTNFIHSLGSGDVFYNEKVMHKFIGPFLLGGEIGHGAFGKVKEGICTQTLQRVAVKIINRKRVKKVPNGIEKVLREIKLLKRLKHKNVVTLIEVYAKVEDENENQGIFNWFSTIEDEPISWPREDGTSEECYVKVLKWYLVFEYCPCTLQTVVDFEKGIKDTSVACRYFNQLAVGLEYIHSQSIIRIII